MPILNFSSLWQIIWKTDLGKRSAGKTADKSSDILGTGVIIELVDLDASGANVVVGQVLLGAGAEEHSFLMSFDPRFRLTAVGDEIVITSKEQDLLHLRVIIRPSSELLWNGASPPSGAGKGLGEAVAVQGRLHFYQNSKAWVWPGSVEVDESGMPLERIKFNNVGSFGFGAYADLTIQNGNLVDGGNTYLHVDENGDGQESLQVSGVLDENSRDLPPVKSVLQVSPNPFNPQTTVSWSLRRGVAERLEVYDMVGRLVRTIVVESAQSGTCVFNGRDEHGGQLASGTYLVLVRDRRGGVGASQKMTLLK